MTNFTPEQEAAINPPYDRNLIMVAGAGSGKTRVLVERYLRLLEDNPDWLLNDLVAITFTQKAAQEMRDRVRQRIQQNMQNAPDEATQTRWARRLGAMSSARIDTIHALCGALLRANAPEVGLDPGFTVVDEVESLVMVEDAVERVLFQMVNAGAEPILALFSRYDANAIREELIRHASGPPLQVPETGAALLTLWQQTWRGQAEPAFQSARNHHVYQDVLAWANANRAHFPAGDKLTAKWLAADNALQLIATIPPNGPVTGVYGWLMTIYDNRAGRSGAKSNWKTPKVEVAREVLDNLVDEWVASLLNALGTGPDETDEDAAELAAAWGVLIGAVQTAYHSAKTADNLLDFNDLERRAATLLDDYPEVRDRYVCNEFKHLLVDEFQDTNADQWRIIEALTAPDEPLNGDPARLFVVGDPKQSIYGFRGGDVRVFEAVRGLINALPTPNGKSAEIPLVRSFRTHRPLVNAFNYIFERLLQRDPASPVAEYEVQFGIPMEAHRENPPIDAPPMEIMLLDRRPRDADDVPLEETSCGKGMIPIDDLRTLEASHIAARIRELVDGQYPVHDKETDEIRAVEYGDIALLFRVTSSVTIYESALREAGVPYVTVAGRGYYDRQEVWDLLALLDALYNPDDELALATALRSPLFNLSDEALYGLRLAAPGKSGPSSLWDALQNYLETLVPEAEYESVARAGEILEQLQATAGRVTIYELLRTALAQTGYLAILTGLPDGVRRRNNVLKLLQKAVESDRVTLSAFTQYLNDMTDREVREGEADTEAMNAVTLMTVHKSKGLEFPVVFIPDASRKGGGGGRNQPLVRETALGGVTCKVPDDVGDLQQPNLYVAAKELQEGREAAEAKRLLYVATTRARDLLCVSGAACWNDKKWGRLTGWLGMLVEVFGLETWSETDDTLPFGSNADQFAVRVWRPRDRDDVETGDDAPSLPQTLWDDPVVQDGQPLGDALHEPPLVRSVPREPGRMAYHLTATQIAHLGSAAYDSDYRAIFRRSVLYDTPAQVSRARLPGKVDQPVSQKKLGEIAHEALRWWNLPKGRDDMRDTLASYAWKYGVVEPERIEFAVNTTHNWLRAFKLPSQEIYTWAEAAQWVARELPFVYRTEKRVIHGVLDMLMQRDDGTWVIVDYKTSNVPGYRENKYDKGVSQNRQKVEDHARRFYLQVGVYAAAVEQYLAERGEDVRAEDIKIYIYYLRYSRKVEVTYGAWRAALNDLETQIGKLIEDDTP